MTLLVVNRANVQTKRKMNQKCMVGQMADQSKRDLVGHSYAGLILCWGGQDAQLMRSLFLLKLSACMGKGEGLISTVLQLIFNPRGGLYSPSPILFLLTATMLSRNGKGYFTAMLVCLGAGRVKSGSSYPADTGQTAETFSEADVLQ